MLKEFNWTNPNGNNIYAAEWAVPDARAVIGLIHGVGEHCRRYDHFAAWLNEQGIAVVGYDRQGFGRSEGKRGHSANLKELLDEISRLTVACERRYPDTPVFLYGHSMGGMLLLRYLVRRHPHISGAVISAPHIRLNFQPSALLVGIGKVMRKIAPTFTQENSLDLDQLSRNLEVRPAYEADPNVHGKLSGQLGIDMLESAAELDEWRGNLPVPTLLMHGSADGLTSHAASRDFAERNPDGVTFKSWEGLYHELHNEPEREEVFGFVLRWLEGEVGEVHRLPESV